ncbi:TetR/AcrR family transcriptional regulator [Saccharopolyspora taberi]|uniref:HTH tetR-type domain-containing protein n=1 Tax=Saccharopolyspora taberi TaxID=60895 RepID=A0ABN3VEN5_9PSEU
MSPRPLAFTDDQLLDAAAAAIAEIGPARLTLADVADRTGASPATLIKRFGSKKGLLAALNTRAAGTVGEAFRRRGTPLARLEAALTGLAGGIDTHQQMAHHVAFLLMDLTDPELHDHTRAFAAGLRAEVRRVLQEAADSGQLHCPDLDELADAVVTAYHGSLITWAIEPEGTLTDRLRRRLRFTLAPFRA